MTARARVALCALLPLAWARPAAAQLDGAHIYWTLPINTNIVGLTAVQGSVNAIWTNFNRVAPSVRVKNHLYFLSYVRTFGLFGRSAMATALLPAGALSIESPLPPGTPAGDDYVQGISDPSLGLTVNLYGAPEQPVREYVRYEQATSISMSVRGTFPVGQYDETRPLNIGSNQWKVRLGLPIVQAIGDWVPGRRATLEVVPTMTILGDNTDLLGQTLDQDPVYAVEGHLTRDFTRRAFASLDYTLLRLGAATYTDNQTGAVIESPGATTAHLVGATLGFELNDNLRLFATYMQTASDDMGTYELSGEVLKVLLTYSWHAVLERTSVLN